MKPLYLILSKRKLFGNLSGVMEFVDNETLLISRKEFGFSYFNIKTGIETHSINWQKKGFAFGQFEKAKIYANGRFVLFNNITPDPEFTTYDERQNRFTSFAYNPFEGLEYILYDIEEDKVIHRQKNAEYATAFHPDTMQFVYIDRKHDEKNKLADYLCILDI